MSRILTPRPVQVIRALGCPGCTSVRNSNTHDAGTSGSVLETSQSHAARYFWTEKRMTGSFSRAQTVVNQRTGESIAAA